MTIGYTRSTKAIVDCAAIRQNVKNELQHANNGVEIFAVVKANGYGHGSIQVAKTAKEAGATGFCVALLDEAIELREGGFSEPILVLGIVDAQYISLAVEMKISVTVASLSWLKEVTKKQLDESGKLNIHVKIDSGMGRIGFREDAELVKAIAYIEEHPSLELEGIYTHFAKADTRDDSYLHLQQERFTHALEFVPKGVRYIHTANSATSLWHNHWQSNMIRLGVSMYGLNPSGRELALPYPLVPAMSLETTLVFCKKVSAGECIGYGAEYQTKQEEWIGTLPIGYADGFIRKFTGYSVLVEGKKCEIIGRVCMDQCMIRLPKEFAVGTKVVIIGKSGDESLTMQDAAEHLGTINYEIPCILSERVPRVYIN